MRQSGPEEREPVLECTPRPGEHPRTSLAHGPGTLPTGPYPALQLPSRPLASGSCSKAAARLFPCLGQPSPRPPSRTRALRPGAGREGTQDHLAGWWESLALRGEFPVLPLPTRLQRAPLSVGPQPTRQEDLLDRVALLPWVAHGTGQQQPALGLSTPRPGSLEAGAAQAWQGQSQGQCAYLHQDSAPLGGRKGAKRPGALSATTMPYSTPAQQVLYTHTCFQVQQGGPTPSRCPPDPPRALLSGRAREGRTGP